MIKAKSVIKNINEVMDNSSEIDKSEISEAGGSGWGKIKKGEVIKDINDLKYDDVILNRSSQFNSKNVVKIVQAAGTGIKKDKAYGLFVDPKNTNKIRNSSDKNFVIWKSDLDSGEYFRAIPPATIEENGKDDTMKKAMASIDKQFGKTKTEPVKTQVSKTDKEQDDIYRGFLKYEIADAQDRNKPFMKKTFTKLLAQFEAGEKQSEDVLKSASFASSKVPMLQLMISALEKYKDKDIQLYLNKYLSRAEKSGVLREWPKALGDIWPKNLKD